jgi:hypothetical protein
VFIGVLVQYCGLVLVLFLLHRVIVPFPYSIATSRLYPPPPFYSTSRAVIDVVGGLAFFVVPYFASGTLSLFFTRQRSVLRAAVSISGTILFAHLVQASLTYVADALTLSSIATAQPYVLLLTFWTTFVLFAWPVLISLLIVMLLLRLPHVWRA